MRHRIAPIFVLCLLVTVAVAAPRHSRHRSYRGSHSSAQSSHAVAARSNLSHVQQNIQVHKQALQQTKVHEHYARVTLTENQQQLESARGKLQTARNQLFTTRNKIRFVQKQIFTTQTRLHAHANAMKGRILAAYRSSAPTPLAVVLSATSYEDLTNRARFAGMVANQDQDMLNHLVGFEQTLQQRQADLSDLETQQQEYHNQVQYQAAQVAQEQDRIKGTLDEIMSNKQELEQQLAEEEAESSRIESMLSALQRRSSSGGGGGYSAGYQGKWSGHFLKPVPGGIGSGFGMRYHPILHYYRMHTGVDLHAGYGEPIHAADKGKVVYADWRGGYGKCVVIDHGSGYATVYAHMSAFDVSAGQVVSRGQVIGRVGATGLATGPHLHFEVRINGTPVNPLNY